MKNNKRTPVIIPRLRNGMFYTDSEIVTMYKRAKNKEDQLYILADLNACKVEKIIDLLLWNGVDIPEEVA